MMTVWFWAVLLFTAIYSRNSEAQFGSTCNTPSQEIGRCDTIYSCDVLGNFVQSEDPKIKQYLRNSFCGWRGSTPLVCCGTRTPFSIEPDTQVSGLLPGKDSCGYQQDSNKILGGNETGLIEFPWVALLEYRSSNRNERKFRCGGALISKRYVLTAAHCASSDVGKIVSVRLGEWNKKTTDDCVGGRFNRKCITAEDIAVEEVKLHENYRFYATELSNDIALIRLKKEVNFVENIQPICLPENAEENSNPGEDLWVSGWGTIDANIKKYSPIKQKVLVPVVPMDRCKRILDREGVSINDMQLCAGGEWGKDSCYGDSGGPLMASRVDDPSQSYIEGIVSFSTACGTNIPGVYTRVSSYLDWIKRNIKP